uniref:Galectin n=1 Tax=Meloidogyne hapla TaxID=6305 RepID=A0A1I8BLA0_MELHA
MYLAILSFIFSTLFIYSSTDDPKVHKPSTPSPTCPPEYTPIVKENVLYERVEFGPCFGMGFLPPKHIEIEVVKKQKINFLIALFGTNDSGSFEGYFYLLFSTVGYILIQPEIKNIEFETANNFKLDFYALQNNTIRVVFTNPDETSYEYIHYSEKDLSRLAFVAYGGDHILRKVTLLKDEY